MRDLILRLIAPKPIHAARPVGVTLLGDSIMHGGIAGLMRELGWPTEILDRSLPGDTAADAWRRMPYELRPYSCVVLQHGTNDLSQGRDPVPYLARMVRYLQDAGHVVMLTGLAPRADGAAAEPSIEIERLARREGARYADWQTVPLDAPDGLHPSPAMARTLAARLVRAML